jgi:hypothetical protein
LGYTEIEWQKMTVGSIDHRNHLSYRKSIFEEFSMTTGRVNTWISLGANIGVIVSILFLAFEINQSTKATTAAASDSVVDGFNTLNMPMISDPQVARVFIVGLYEPDKLTDVEAVQFAMWLRSLVNQHMRLRRLSELGLYANSERLPNVKQLAAFMSTPGGKLFLQSNKIFPKDLLNEIQPFLGQEPKSDFILGRDGLQTD